MAHIVAVDTSDVRFPTSSALDGSDAMNPAPDYSAAYCVIRTDADDGLDGHGFTFTIGRGNELCVAAIRSLVPLIIGASIDDLRAEIGDLHRRLTGDSQFRWLGPEKGVIHLAAAALTNALWDLLAKREKLPLWRLLCDLSPDEIVACIDFRYLTDAIDRDRALALLRDLEPSRAARIARLEQAGLPAYTTSAGWLGYDDEKIERLCRDSLAAGWTAFKLKVGNDPGQDRRRAETLRRAIGDGGILMLDANQVWDVDRAILETRALADLNPLWIEEPTSPDDILGHARIAREVAPVGVATGEHVHNRVMFKQLLMANAISHCQIDACRLAGVNEALAVIVLAAHFGVPVCPHAGGVGLCELVQHLSAFDYVSVSGTLDGRHVEYVDHLHEHFAEPVRIESARYRMPARPGYAELLDGSRAANSHRPDAG